MKEIMNNLRKVGEILKLQQEAKQEMFRFMSLLDGSHGLSLFPSNWFLVRALSGHQISAISSRRFLVLSLDHLAGTELTCGVQM